MLELCLVLVLACAGALAATEVVILGAGNGSVRSPGGETVPQGYADAVAEYFRKLSKSK